MYETLPNVAPSDHVPGMFVLVFSIMLIMMICALVVIAIARARARRAGIYRKYVVRTDRPNHRRMVDSA